MSVAAMTIDETHANVIKSELIQNNGNLLHKINTPQTVNSTTSSNYFGGHDGIDTDAVLNNKLLQHPSLHLSTTSAVTLPKHEIFSINTSTNSSSIEKHCRLLEEENQSLKVDQTRLQQQCSDAQRRERILMRRLANKEQEFQDYVSQIAEYKLAQAPGAVALRSALLDPAVNLLFEKLKKELQTTKAKLEETQNELSAWKFTPDSNTGKRLMAKCRLLYQENEELGKMTSNGRLAKLETELAMQKSFSEEVKKSQSELDDFLQELDEDVEGMQSTILFLQQQLKGTKELIHNLEKENYQLKNGIVAEHDTPVAEHLVTNGSSSQQEQHLTIPIVHLPTIKENDNEFQINTESNNEKRTSNHNSYIISTSSNLVETNMNINKINVNSEFYSCVIENRCIDEKSVNKTISDVDAESNNDDKLNIRRANLRKRNYDSDSTDSTSSIIRCPAGGINKKIKKKSRRSSMLSIDLDDDNNQISISNRVIIGSDQLPNIDDEGNSICNNQRIVTRRKSVRNQQNGTGEVN